RVFTFLKNQRVSPPMLYNEVRLLTNGEQKFPALIEAMGMAKHHIHLEYYIFETDTIGNQLIGLLKERVLAGVAVRIIADDFGSPAINKQRKRLAEAGIEFVSFLPVTFSSLANGNYRNHRKIAIIDGETAFVGGINISDKYINGVQQPLYWRDTAVQILGQAVNVLQTQFWVNWHLAGGASFSLRDGYFYTAPMTPRG